MFRRHQPRYEGSWWAESSSPSVAHYVVLVMVPSALLACGQPVQSVHGLRPWLPVDKRCGTCQLVVWHPEGAAS